MTNIWLPFATKHDLSASKGYGPFAPGNFHGVVVHVNVDENGTTDAFFDNNPADVCPNFQVYKDGTVHQYLPLDWQPWCQISGNQTFAAIETAGLPSEPYTSAQIASIGKILKAYNQYLGLKLVITDSPSGYGVGTHSMGGAAWGGHSCPGTIRANQRPDLLKAAGSIVGPSPAPSPAPKPATVSSHPVAQPWPGPKLGWGSGDYFGLISGPAQSHGGYNANEKPYVKLIQQQLIRKGFVYGVTDPNSGWADGIFEQPTADAVARFQRHYMPGTTFYGQVWSDDWAKLFSL